MTDTVQPQNNPLPLSTTSATESISYSIFDEGDGDGSILITGTTVGIADGAEISILITDQFDNSITVVALVEADQFVVSGIDTSMLSPGPLSVIASVNDLIQGPENPYILEGLQAADPITIQSSTLDASNKISIQGTANAFKEEEITLVIRDTNGTSVTATALVNVDGEFSVSNISTQGLMDGVLVVDVLAQTSNGAVSIENADTLILANKVPAGTDKTLAVNEDTAMALTVADFGYVTGDGFSMTGIKIASKPSKGTLKLNGVEVPIDQFVSLAQINAGQLVFQGAQDGNGNAYDTFKFKVLDNRPTNNEDPTPNTLTFNVTAVNDAPELASGSTLAYTENNAATPINTVITVADKDSATLASATVAITAGFNSAQDVLSFVNAGMGNIAGVYNTATGVMTLTSAGNTATLAQWQAALRAVSYSNSSDNPTTAARTVSYTVNDGSTNGNTVTSTVNVTAVNDAPVLATGSTLAYTENNAATPINTVITVADADSTSLASATVAITAGFNSAQDVLSFTNVGMGNISGAYNATTGVMTLTSAGNTATLAQWQAALRAVSYNNSSDNPTTAARTVSYTVNDGSLGGNTVTSTVNVTPVNDAPVLATTASTLAYTENNAATPINTLITVADVDNTTLASATVAITAGFNSAQDVLSFVNAGMGNIAGVYNTATGVMTLTSAGNTATLAQWQAALRAVSYNNSSDNPTTAARTVSYTVNDGSTNGNTVTSTVNVTAVNDAPVLATTASTLAYTENNAATPINTVVTVADVDNTTLASATVAITAGFNSAQDVLSFVNAGMGNIAGVYNTATGVMTLTSAGNTATLAQWQAALRAVSYNNSSDNPTTAARTVSYTVNDGSLGGNTVTSTVNVTPVNDAPVLATTASTLAYTENNAATPINTVVTVADVDNTTLASATVAITAGFNSAQDVLSFVNAGMGNIAGVYDPATGVMTLTSAGNTATLAQWQAALRAVSYSNSSDNPTTAARTVSYTVNDGSTNGNTVTSTVNVTPVNDAPVLATGSTLAYTENNAATPINTLITVADADSTNLASATVAITAGFSSGQDVLSFVNAGMGNIAGVYNTATGVMTLTSAGNTATLAQWQAALRAVSYSNSSDNPTTAARTVSYTVNDDIVNGNTVTSTVNVTAVNDAPVLATGSTLAYTENNAATPINTLITVADVDNTTLASATVAITAGFSSGQDVLSFVNAGMGNIAGVYNTATGVMTLTSAGNTATLAQWQAALRAVSYNNSSDNPTTAARTVSYTVNDGSTNGNTVTSTVNVTAVNDAPVLATGSTLAYTENNAATPINTLITVADADSTNLASATVAITAGFSSGQDVLSFVNAGMGNIAGVYNTATGVMTLTSAGNTATLAQWQAALRAVSYSNSSDNPTTAARTVSYTVNDGSLGGNTVTSTVNVTPVNDAPVLADTPLTLTAVAQDAAVPTGPTGVLVNTLLSGQSDVDASPLKGLAITGVNGNGKLYFSTNGGSTWTEATGISNTNALLLGSDTDNRIYFKPNAGYNGTATDAVTFRAWDQTSGTEGTYASTATNGGTSAFSATTDTISQQVVRPVTINTVSTDSIIVMNEAVPLSGTANPNATVNLDINGKLRTVTADGDGNWTYDSKLVPLVRYVMVRKENSIFNIAELKVIVDGVDIAAGKPVSYGLGKVEPGAILNTFSILTDGNVGSFHEANIGAGTEAWVELDLGGYFRVDSIQVTQRNGWAERLNGAKISTSLTQQSLLNSAELQAAAAATPPTVSSTTVSGLTADSFWQVFTATQPNATNEDPFINGANVITATQTVSGVTSNDTENVTWQAIAPGADGIAPVFTSGPTASVVENIATSTAVYDAQATDAGAGNDVGITYSLGGVDASKFDISATGVVTFKASPNFEAPSDVGANNVYNIIVTAKDASNNASYQNVAITVTNINDAPTGTNKTIDMNEDATRSFSAADFGFADAPGENHTLSAVVITSLPASGTLKLGTVNVLAGAVIPVADLGSLNYTPALNDNGNAYASFGFKVRDSGGVANGGIDTSVNANTITFNIAPVNDPATFGGDISKNVDETNAALTVTGTLAVADVDSATTVTALSDVNGTAGYGKFSITTAGAWTYVMNTPQNQFVAGQTYTDTIEVTTADGTKQVISVVISGTNDAPTMASSSTALGQITFVEDGAPIVARGGTITLADVDSANLTGATVRVVNFADATSFVPGDLLTYTIPGGSGITGDYNTSTGVLTFTGTATQAQYQSLLNSVMYSNLREDLAGGARNVYWSVKDASGATSNEALSRLSVSRLNDAPVLADTNLNLTTIQPTTAETLPTGAVGVLVSTLVGGVTDGDGTTVAKGIAVIGANDALGKVFFSVNNGGSWFSPAGTISNSAALLLKADATTRVYFRPNAGVEGNIPDAMTIRAWDTTDSKVSLVSNNVSLHAITATGGITPYSTATDTVALSVLTQASSGGLNGTAGADTLTGTAGNDVIVGNGGADQITAAAGNDKVVLNVSNVTALSADTTPTIDGGTGVNTLKLSGAELLLDLSNVTVQDNVDNFSVIDITSNVNNLLKLNLLNVQTLSGTTDNGATPADESKMLVVNGDAGDAVILHDAASWTVLNSLVGSSLATTYGADYGFSSTRRYSQYSKDGATLFVDELAPVADIVGTSGNNTLTGTANADVIFGNGGVDTINAGAGNDTVILNASSISALNASTNSATINGEAGVNTLKISGVNQTLDLTNLTVSPKLDNFNVIDLKQGSGNRFKLHLDQVLSLAGGTDNAATAGVDESKMLVLQGNGGTPLNRLQLADSVNWTSVTNLGGTSLQNTFGAEYGFEPGRSYTQYTNGTANLFVDQSLVQEML